MNVIRECTNPDCRFRYPDLKSPHPKAYCPKCGQIAAISETIDLDSPEGNKTALKPAGSGLKVILDNIRSIYNVGSIFRTSDGFGVDELLLCGITPTPDHPRFSKTSLGAEKTIQWSYHKNAVLACRSLKEQGYLVFSMEKLPETTNLYAISKESIQKPLVLVVGNEVCGVDPGVLRESDRVLSIPMVGQKSSFNVATAYGIAVSYFYALFND